MAYVPGFGNLNNNQGYFGGNVPNYNFSNSFTSPFMPKRDLIKVNGIEGANLYNVGPGETVPLFDANQDVLYIKSTDDAGYATIRKFSFMPIVDEPQVTANNYVTKDELASQLANLKEELSANAKQPVFREAQQSVFSESNSAGEASGKNVAEFRREPGVQQPPAV